MKFLFVIFVFILQNSVASEKFSDLAWKQITPLYQKIKKHPFNEELLAGTLSKERFDYYSSQDSYYLSVFAKALAVLGTKLEDPKETQFAFEMSRDCLKEKRRLESNNLNRATFAYTHFLLSTAAFQSREELAAALLPCFWIYQRLAEEMKGKTSSNNPYYSWIKLYASDKYKKSTDKMIALIDELAAQATQKQFQKMVVAFEAASKLEWEFWDEAYRSN